MSKCLAFALVLAFASCEAAPPGWTCAASWYNARDGCDCECGVHDPDCDVAGQTLYWCAGQCVDATCVPSTWTCSASWYGTSDGCDCECGAHDPDCDAPATLYWCDGVCINGQCFPADAPAGAPPSWTCSASWYNANDGCDCECGAHDPDCEDPSQTLFWCDATCVNGECVDVPAGPPASWTCSASWYGTHDGCDCECGDVDPDCADPSQTLFWCDGTCVAGNCVPNSWTCSPSYWDAQDGCDCCGAPDPDCNLPGQTLYFCSGTCQNGVCFGNKITHEDKTHHAEKTASVTKSTQAKQAKAPAKAAMPAKNAKSAKDVEKHAKLAKQTTKAAPAPQKVRAEKEAPRKVQKSLDATPVAGSVQLDTPIVAGVIGFGCVLALATVAFVLRRRQ